MDFTNPLCQEDVWQIFISTDWSNGVYLNYTLGDSGIAFATEVDNYEDFISVFENRLIAVLKAFDNQEANGETVIGNPHKYKFVEYEKIVSCILYCMLLEDYYYHECGGCGLVYSFNNDSEEASVGFLDMAKTIYQSLDEDYKQYFDVAADFYLNNDFKDYAKENLGYTDETVDTALWGVLGLQYFGVCCGSFDTLVKHILRVLTKEDGTLFNLDENGNPCVYYFDPYKKGDLYNFVCLDSIAFYFNGSIGDSLFQSFIKSEDRFDLAEEYEEKRIEFSTMGTAQWESYASFRENYVDTYGDNIPSYLLDWDYISFSGEYDDETLNAIPGGYAQGNSFGWFYYVNYQASRVVNHKINGITGEVVE